MKSFIKVLLAAAAMFCVSFGASAYGFEVDGIYYNITSEADKTVEVTSGGNSYVGDVSIPATVENAGTIYTVTKIGDEAFSWSGLTSVDIPEGVTAIEFGAFMGCGLTSIDIPDGVVSIGDYAFSYCSSLTEINCRATVPPVCGPRSFDGVDKTACTLNVPEGAEEAYKTADVWKEFLYEYFMSGGIKYGALTSSQGNIATVLAGGEYTGDIAIPETVENGGITYTVTEIGGRAFYNCIRLESVTLGSGLETIGESAFYGCFSLVSVDIPDGVVSIGDEAFSYCSSLESVTFGSGVGIIGDEAFIDCSSLTEITCRATVPPVCGERCFANIDISNCTLSVPEGAEEAYITADVWKEFLYEYFISGGIKYGALTSSQGNIAMVLAGGEYTGDITIPATVENGGITYTVTEIGGRAFYECEGLVSINIPDGVTSIGDEAFYECLGLESVTFGSGVGIIGDNAFMGCSSLAEITCRATVPPVCGERCFSDVDISNCTLSVPEVAEEAYKTADVWKEFFYEYFISGGIRYGAQTSPQGNIATVLAGEYTGDITIPATVENGGITYTVTSIGDRAFYYCSSLESVTLGSGLETIGDYAFYGCRSLAEITCRATVPPVCGPRSFDYVDKYACTLNVPEGTADDYRAADGWKEFFNIVETDFAGSGEIAADAAAAAKVYAAAGRIVVENAAAGTPIAVYTADGVQVYGGTASDGRTEIPAQAGKLYIVRCGNAAYKTAM